MTSFWSAIVNSAILSALLSLAASLALRITPRRALNGASRYAIWWIVLAVTLALPLSHVEMRVTFRKIAAAPPRFAEVSRQLQWEGPVVESRPAVARGLALPLEIPASPWLRSVMFFWIAGSTLLLARVFVSYAALYCRSARATAWDERIAGARQVRIAISNEIEIPIATGPFRPAILIPARLFEQISAVDLDQIVSHEAAHLARRDDYALFIQRVIEALFALHPVVRWLTRQIDLEREIACDDIVVGSTDSARSYAECLTRMVALCGGVRPSLAATSVADSRSHLSRRIELLVNKRRTTQTTVLLGRFAVIAIALMCAAEVLAKTPLLISFAVPPPMYDARDPLAIDHSFAPRPKWIAQAQAQAPAAPESQASPSVPPKEQTPFEQQLAAGIKQRGEKQFDDAIATFLQIVPDAPDDHAKGQLWVRISEAYLSKNDPTSSIHAMERAFALLPDDAGVATDLGLLYEKQGDNLRARQFYERAIASDPNNPLALNNLAYLLTETSGDLDLALGYARAAKAQVPALMEISDTIGWIYLKKNMPDDAIEEFRTATESVPGNPTYHYHYALALQQKGDLTAALNQCQLALADKPANDLEQNIRGLTDKLAPQVDAPFPRTPGVLKQPPVK